MRHNIVQHAWIICIQFENCCTESFLCFIAGQVLQCDKSEDKGGLLEVMKYYDKQRNNTICNNCNNRKP